MGGNQTRTTHSPKQLSFGGAFDAKSAHRWFFAIQPDVYATDRLTRLMTQPRYEKIMSGRPVDPDRLPITLRSRVNPAFNPHVTLSYDFSDVPEQRVDPIRRPSPIA